MYVLSMISTVSQELIATCTTPQAMYSSAGVRQKHRRRETLLWQDEGGPSLRPRLQKRAVCELYVHLLCVDSVQVTELEIFVLIQNLPPPPPPAEQHRRCISFRDKTRSSGLGWGAGRRTEYFVRRDLTVAARCCCYRGAKPFGVSYFTSKAARLILFFVCSLVCLFLFFPFNTPEKEESSRAESEKRVPYTPSPGKTIKPGAS